MYSGAFQNETAYSSIRQSNAAEDSETRFFIGHPIPGHGYTLESLEIPGIYSHVL